MTPQTDQPETVGRTAGLLPEVLRTYQALSPHQLLSRRYVALQGAAELAVTRQAVLMYLTRHVATGLILEIKPRRDWRVDLPGGEDLPVLYAAPVDERFYALQLRSPQSRGAGQTSFVITPEDLETLLAEQRNRLGLPPRVPGAAPVYRPDRDQVVMTEVYEQMVRDVMGRCSVGRAQASITVNTLLRSLCLLPPDKQ